MTSFPFLKVRLYKLYTIRCRKKSGTFCSVGPGIHFEFNLFYSARKGNFTIFWSSSFCQNGEYHRELINSDDHIVEKSRIKMVWGIYIYILYS
jgi:hypothetical protein